MGSTFCTFCPRGYGTQDTGNEECAPCPIGYYSLAGGDCRPAPPGTFINTTAAYLYTAWCAGLRGGPFEPAACRHKQSVLGAPLHVCSQLRRLPPDTVLCPSQPCRNVEQRSRARQLQLVRGRKVLQHYRLHRVQDLPRRRLLQGSVLAVPGLPRRLLCAPWQRQVQPLVRQAACSCSDRLARMWARWAGCRHEAAAGTRQLLNPC